MTSGSRAPISVASSEADTWVQHQRLGHMNKKGIKVVLSKDKLVGLKFVELDFCENYVYGKQKRVSFSMVRKTSKAEK